MRALTTRVTRADVARLAGTSTAVVSYVINNGPRPVAPATRDRVLAVIERTRYRPDGIAKALAAGSTGTYGLVVPDISNPFFSSIAHAVEDELFAAHRVLLLGDSAESPEREREILATLQQQRVDGVLFIGRQDGSALHELAMSGTPVVVLDRVEEASVASSVSVDNAAAAAAATRHLVDHGYRRIGMLGGPETASTARARRSGWEQAMHEAGLSIRPDWVSEAVFSRTGGLEAGRRLFAEQELPEALFIASDQQAIGLLRAAHEADVAVPDDIAIVTFDGTDDSAYCIPPLSTIRQPVEELARAAVALLLGASHATRITVDFELVVRRSCGCEAA